MWESTADIKGLSPSEFTLDAIYTFAPTLLSRSSALIGTHSLIVSCGLFDVSRALGNDFHAREGEEKGKKKETRREEREENEEGWRIFSARVYVCAPSNERKFM